MKYFVCVALLSLSLPGCFTSTGLNEEACEPNPCAWTIVEFCEESRECGVLDWCGETIYCALAPTPTPTPPPECTDPRPACGDGVEVSACPGNANCTYVEWCGGGFYCASEACDGAFPVCPGGETPSEVACSPGEAGCTALTGCDEGYYCREEIDCLDPVFEPCMDATSTVWEIGEAQCPDFDSEAYCYESLFCGADYYCVTACAPGDSEVFHPSECVNSSDCYPSNPWRDDLPQTWCQGGGGPACRAIPTCESGEEIPLNAGCDDDSYCEYRSVCSTTIQCAFGPVLG